MQALTLLGTYCNRNGNSWNPDSNQPNVQAWKEGRDNFGQTVGHPVNSGNIFGPPTNTANALGGNIKYKLGMVNQVYTNPPYDYIPAFGVKLAVMNDVSPKTKKKYVWNDPQAYQDVADGLWDDSWRAIVDAMIASKRTVWFQRIAYEANCSFMEDFSGYNKETAKVKAWCAGMRRAFVTIKEYAAQKGVYPIIGVNPACSTQNDPTVETTFDMIGADCQNVIGFDVYNGYWGLPPNKCPTDVSGKQPGLGPQQADLIATWNRQNGGWGFDHASALALKHNLPLAIQECGASGGSHHTLNDPYFYPWLASAIKQHRAKGGKVILVNIWSVPAGDGNWNIQYGAQPPTLNSLRGDAIATLVGDTFDPSQLKWGGGTQPPITPPVEPPVIPPVEPPVVTPPIVVPPNPSAHETWVLTGKQPDGSQSSTVTFSVPVGTEMHLTGPT